jgi:Fe-S cluster biogenesis protein NfuA
MFIQTETTGDPATLRFLPGRVVLEGGNRRFVDAEAAAVSPLAARLFAVDGVAAVELGAEDIVVTKGADSDWQVLKPPLLGAIMEHFVAGAPVLNPDAPEAAAAESADAASALDLEPADSELVVQLRELIDTRIRPAAKQAGGDVALYGFGDGVVYLQLQGAAYGLMNGIANMLRHYVPEVEAVRDYLDAIPKPGLDTPEGVAIRQLLDERINPAVAGHGGHITLIDVKDATAYIRLQGGCQGCGMAEVTLRQGVEVEIKKAVPTIRAVRDVTDHASGTNPYFESDAGGASPV